MIHMETNAVKYQAAVAAQLDEERRRVGLTFDELTDATSLARASVTRYLKNQRDIPFAALAELCAALGVSVVELVGRAEQRLGN